MRKAISAFLALSGIDFISGQSRQREAATRIQRTVRRVVAARARERRRVEAAGSPISPLLGKRRESDARGTPREQRANLLRRVSETNGKLRPRANSVYDSPNLPGRSEADLL